MSNTLRFVLLVAALITAIWILRKIYKCKVKLADAIFWLCMALILAVLGIVPEIAYWCAGAIGFQAPVNFIFLMIIALLMEKLFTLSIMVSQLEDKITILSAEVALRSQNADREIVNLLEKEANNE